MHGYLVLSALGWSTLGIKTRHKMFSLQGDPRNKASCLTSKVIPRASFRRGQGGAFTPNLSESRPPLGTCKHCMKRGNKTSDASPNFSTNNFRPLNNFSKWTPAYLEHQCCILPGVPPINEPLHIGVEPVHEIRAWSTVTQENNSTQTSWPRDHYMY